MATAVCMMRMRNQCHRVVAVFLVSTLLTTTITVDHHLLAEASAAEAAPRNTLQIQLPFVSEQKTDSGDTSFILGLQERESVATTMRKLKSFSEAAATIETTSTITTTTAAQPPLAGGYLTSSAVRVEGGGAQLNNGAASSAQLLIRMPQQQRRLSHNGEPPPLLSPSLLGRSSRNHFDDGSASLVPSLLRRLTAIIREEEVVDTRRKRMDALLAANSANVLGRGEEEDSNSGGGSTRRRYYQDEGNDIGYDLRTQPLQPRRQLMAATEDRRIMSEAYHQSGSQRLNPSSSSSSPGVLSSSTSSSSLDLPYVRRRTSAIRSSTSSGSGPPQQEEGRRRLKNKQNLRSLMTDSLMIEAGGESEGLQRRAASFVADNSEVGGLRSSTSVTPISERSGDPEVRTSPRRNDRQSPLSMSSGPERRLPSPAGAAATTEKDSQQIRGNSGGATVGMITEKTVLRIRLPNAADGTTDASLLLRLPVDGSSSTTESGTWFELNTAKYTHNPAGSRDTAAVDRTVSSQQQDDKEGSAVPKKTVISLIRPIAWGKGAYWLEMESTLDEGDLISQILSRSSSPASHTIGTRGGLELQHHQEDNREEDEEQPDINLLLSPPDLLEIAVDGPLRIRRSPLEPFKPLRATPTGSGQGQRREIGDTAPQLEVLDDVADGKSPPRWIPLDSHPTVTFPSRSDVGGKGRRE